jgi:SPX domain protein involved in polyphosphate accumulation
LVHSCSSVVLTSTRSAPCLCLVASLLQTLDMELAKVSQFYVKEEARLLASLREARSQPLNTKLLVDLHSQVQWLFQYAALNYVAVVKAVKKRNRRLRDACGDQVVTVQPLNYLQDQVFFEHKELAHICAGALKLGTVRSASLSRNARTVMSALSAQVWSCVRKIVCFMHMFSQCAFRVDKTACV